MAKRKTCPTCSKEKAIFLIDKRKDGNIHCDSCWLDILRVIQAMARRPKTTLQDIKAVRDRLLRESDFVAFPSTRDGMSDTKLAEWDTYRQSLRDITNDCVDFDKVVFPQKPD